MAVMWGRTVGCRRFKSRLSFARCRMEMFPASVSNLGRIMMPGPETMCRLERTCAKGLGALALA